MHISIIGAGPIGCYCGYLLAKSGHEVEIYEKGDIGRPIQCTGLLTADFDLFEIDKSSFLMNTFEQVEINSPQNKLILKQKEYLVCREKFDNHLAKLALTAGAKIFLHHTFLRKEGQKLIIKNSLGEEKEIIPGAVIAADGPLSPTAKAYGFYHGQRENYVGIQAIVKGNFEAKKYQTFFGSQVCPDLFAWIVPESEERARVGLAAKKKATEQFDQLMNKNGFAAAEIQAGPIPLYHPDQKLSSENCYLLGDASGFVKATTLGGIIPGMKQAEILAHCLNKDKDYDQEIKVLKKKMDLHLRIRTTMDKFSDGDWDKLVSLIGQEKIKMILEKHTRENPQPILLKALWKEPRLIYFMKFLR